MRKKIHSLKLVDYLHVQADNPWYKNYLLPSNSWPKKMQTMEPLSSLSLTKCFKRPILLANTLPEIALIVIVLLLLHVCLSLSVFIAHSSRCPGWIFFRAAVGTTVTNGVARTRWKRYTQQRETTGSSSDSLQLHPFSKWELLGGQRRISNAFGVKCLVLLIRR